MCWLPVKPAGAGIVPKGSADESHAETENRRRHVNSRLLPRVLSHASGCPHAQAFTLAPWRQRSETRGRRPATGVRREAARHRKYEGRHRQRGHGRSVANLIGDIPRRTLLAAQGFPLPQPGLLFASPAGQKSRGWRVGQPHPARWQPAECYSPIDLTPVNAHDICGPRPNGGHMPLPDQIGFW
jgi:hypothetical protein